MYPLPLRFNQTMTFGDHSWCALCVALRMILVQLHLVKYCKLVLRCSEHPCCQLLPKCCADTYKQARQTDRQTARQTDRQIGRQTKQTDKPRGGAGSARRLRAANSCFVKGFAPEQHHFVRALLREHASFDNRLMLSHFMVQMVELIELRGKTVCVVVAEGLCGESYRSHLSSQEILVSQPNISAVETSWILSECTST